MAINGKTVDEKLQYDINRKAAKISALSSGKNDKYYFLTGAEILPSHQSRITELVYSWKTFLKNYNRKWNRWHLKTGNRYMYIYIYMYIYLSLYIYVYI